MTMRLLCALPLAAALLAPACALAEPSAIYIVRHAEKAPDGKDPDLTADGQARARNIATMLQKAGVTHVFSTSTARTRETAQPLAERAGVTVEAYDPRAPQALVDKVRALDGAVLVVGHSNTVPALVRLFGGDEADKEIPETEYNRLYQLTPGPDGKLRTVRLTSVP
ncbi:MAG: SixA phosphatase family protein [Telluria sp.]